MNRAKFNSGFNSGVTSPVTSRVTRSFLQVVVWCAVVALSAGVALAAQDTAAQNAGSQNADQAAATAAGQRTDGQIEMDVVHALDASQPLKDDLITAATIQSEVTLAGTVATDASKKLAESIVSQVPGVTKVHNNLKVGDPQQAQEQMNLPSMDESGAGQGQGGQQYPQQGQPAEENGQQGNDQQGQGPMPPPGLSAAGVSESGSVSAARAVSAVLSAGAAAIWRSSSVSAAGTARTTGTGAGL